MGVFDAIEKQIINDHRRALRQALQAVAKEITMEVKQFIYKKIYLRPPSDYYDRDGDNGGFLETFVTEDGGLDDLVDAMTRTVGDKMYVTYVLRDFSHIKYRKRTRNQLGHHTSFEGVPTSDRRARSELDNLMDTGWYLYDRGGGYHKIEGTQFKEFARDYVKNNAARLIQEKMASLGYAPTISQGRKRLSIPLDEIEIITT